MIIPEKLVRQSDVELYLIKVAESMLCVSENREITLPDGGKEQLCVGAYALKSFADKLQYIPAVDAVPVVHARWVYTDEGYKVCTNCSWEHPVLDNNGFAVADTFCPSCGAKMDGGDEQ